MFAVAHPGGPLEDGHNGGAGLGDRGHDDERVEHGRAGLEDAWSGPAGVGAVADAHRPRHAGWRGTRG